MDKYCSGCKTTHPFGGFSKNRAKKDGYSNWCKGCIKLLWQKPENLQRRKDRRLVDYGHTLFIETKSRARAAGLPFDLDESDTAIPEFCPVTGVQMMVTPGQRTYNTPTVDRKEPALGYVKGNVFVISWLANKIKSDQTDPVLFEKIAEYLRRV